MATVSNIVINDGTANQTFSPVQRNGDRLTFLNRAGAIASGWKSIVLGFSLHSLRRKTDKVFVDLTFPILRDVDGVQVVTDKALGRAQFVFPESMLESEKTEFLALWRALNAHASITGYANGDPMVG